MTLTSEALADLIQASEDPTSQADALNIMANLETQSIPWWLHREAGFTVACCTTGCGNLKRIDATTNPGPALTISKHIGKPIVSTELQNGSTILIVNRLPALSEPITALGQADCLILTGEAAKLAAVAVATGDCPCVLMVDPIAGIVGIAHVTYKNGFLHIVRKAIDTFFQVGASFSSARFVVTPGTHSIGVYASVYEAYGNVLRDARTDLRDHYFVRTNDTTNPFVFNLHSATVQLVRQSGIPDDHIATCALDTSRWFHLLNSNRHSPTLELRTQRCGQLGWLA